LKETTCRNYISKSLKYNGNKKNNNSGRNTTTKKKKRHNKNWWFRVKGCKIYQGNGP
jgi:hypothetical protein